jgi:hypothetical protein
MIGASGTFYVLHTSMFLVASGKGSIKSKAIANVSQMLVLGPAHGSVYVPSTYNCT